MPVKLTAVMALVAVPSRSPVKCVAITLALIVMSLPLRGLMVSVVITSKIPLPEGKVVSLKSYWKLVSAILNSRINKKNNAHFLFVLFLLFLLFFTLEVGWY